jgi:predicted nuclease of restriction endonuclease-like RecB superfamily
MSALSLADVRWRSRRDPAGGPPFVRVSFLTDPADPRQAAVVGGIAAYLASLAGQRRRDYDPDVPVAIAGDRRLGRGLAAVCMDWYRWTARDLSDALPDHVVAALARAGLDSPSALRLRLFDLANDHYAGFVPATRRSEILVRLAEGLGLGPADAAALDLAMTLDARDEAVLTPPAAPPTTADVAARYNRAVLAALLRQAERIVFTVHAPAGGLLRRMYARCRRLGVYCDVEADGPHPLTPSPNAGRGGDPLPSPGGGGAGGGGRPAGGEVLQPPAPNPHPPSAPFRLTLSGPEAVVGPLAVAGTRLAVAALHLLAHLGRDDHAEARLILHDRPYRLILDSALLCLPGLASDEPGADEGWNPESESEEATTAASPLPNPRLPTPAYDSEVEARFAREFAALARQGRTAGWRLVREPAPLLAGGRVLIPDFGLERDGVRVFVEVVGFWTPGYLGRKRQALERLEPDTPLVLAVSDQAAATFAGLPFPIVLYRGHVRVPDLLAAVEAHHGGYADRTRDASGRLAAACADDVGGWIDETRLETLLGCYSPGEVARTLAAVPPPNGWEYVPGAGLLGASLRLELSVALEQVWRTRAADAVLSPADVRALASGATLPAGDEALAAVLERLPACRVVRGSLFQVAVYPAAAPDAGPVEQIPGPAEPARPNIAPVPRRRRARAAKPAPPARPLL